MHVWRKICMVPVVQLSSSSAAGILVLLINWYHKQFEISEPCWSSAGGGSAYPRWAGNNGSINTLKITLLRFQLSTQAGRVKYHDPYITSSQRLHNFKKGPGKAYCFDICTRINIRFLIIIIRSYLASLYANLKFGWEVNIDSMAQRNSLLLWYPYLPYSIGNLWYLYTSFKSEYYKIKRKATELSTLSNNPSTCTCVVT